MTQKLVLVFIFLLSAAWLQAQEQAPATVDGQNRESKTRAMGQTEAGAINPGQNTTVEGCLQGSSGNYSLTDLTGKKWRLQGDDSQLSNYVGHEIKVNGTPSNAGARMSGSTTAGPNNGGPDTGTPMASGSNAGTQPATLQVTHVKHLSKACKAGS